MKSLFRSPTVKKILMSVSCGPLLRKLENASKNLKAAQQRVLTKMIADASSTVFGKEHRFSTIKTIADYQKAVPVRDFEGHRPYIERMCNGEPDILISGKPFFYNTTSGTTDQPKLIPVGEKYFSTTSNEINRLWLYSCLRDNPTLFHGQNFSAVAPAVEGHVNDGTPFGSISGHIYRNIPKLLHDLYSTPYPIICIKDYTAKYYAMLRCGLASTISYIITVNPSTLIQFHRTVLENSEDLIRDIYNGTLRPDIAAEIDPEDRFKVLKTFTPSPERARQLESIFQTHDSHLLPLHYWPDLVCINTWKQGNCSLILPKISHYYPKHTILREFGYQASEIRGGLVFGNDWNHSLLLAHYYLFEFIEVSTRSQDSPPVLQAHEVEIGKSYYILFSNTSGLYRYDINDIVRITGFYNEFPLFEFIQKGEGVTSLTGEKISEVQVIRAAEEAAKKQHLDISFYTMFCDREEFIYKLYVEFPADTLRQQKTRFIAMIDNLLKEFNPEYAVKRNSHRLHAPKLIEMAPNSYELLKKSLVDDNLVREGQYKVRYLHDDRVLMQRYETLLIKQVVTHQ